MHVIQFVLGKTPVGQSGSMVGLLRLDEGKPGDGGGGEEYFVQ